MDFLPKIDFKQYIEEANQEYKSFLAPRIQSKVRFIADWVVTNHQSRVLEKDKILFRFTYAPNFSYIQSIDLEEDSKCYKVWLSTTYDSTTTVRLTVQVPKTPYQGCNEDFVATKTTEMSSQTRTNRCGLQDSEIIDIADVFNSNLDCIETAIETRDPNFTRAY